MSILDKLIDVDTWSYHMHGGYWTREVLDSNVFISAKNELAALRAEREEISNSISFHLDDGEVPDNLAQGVEYMMLQEYYPMVEKVDRLTAENKALRKRIDALLGLPFTTPSEVDPTRDEIIG